MKLQKKVVSAILKIPPNGRKNRELIKNLLIDNSVIDRAVLIRQNKKVSLGDSIIAATVLNNNEKLFTNNEEDFRDIDGIDIIPMKSIV